MVIIALWVFINVAMIVYRQLEYNIILPYSQLYINNVSRYRQTFILIRAPAITERKNEKIEKRKEEIMTSSFNLTVSRCGLHVYKTFLFQNIYYKVF